MQHRSQLEQHSLRKLVDIELHPAADAALVYLRDVAKVITTAAPEHTRASPIQYVDLEKFNAIYDHKLFQFILRFMETYKVELQHQKQTTDNYHRLISKHAALSLLLTLLRIPELNVAIIGRQVNDLKVMNIWPTDIAAPKQGEMSLQWSRYHFLMLSLEQNKVIIDIGSHNGTAVSCSGQPQAVIEQDPAYQSGVTWFTQVLKNVYAALISQSNLKLHQHFCPNYAMLAHNQTASVIAASMNSGPCKTVLPENKEILLRTDNDRIGWSALPVQGSIQAQPFDPTKTTKFVPEYFEIGQPATKTSEPLSNATLMDHFGKFASECEALPMSILSAATTTSTVTTNTQTTENRDSTAMILDSGPQ